MGAASSSVAGDSPAARHAGRAPGAHRHDHRQMMPSGTGEHFGVVARERKKKVTGFATLRKKLIRRRRSSKAYDHARVLREFVSDWSVSELSALVDEYEALLSLKDLTVQADLARPPASTYKQDLSGLFDYKYCTDVDLVFQGACFPVHRAILSARCPYFRQVLAKCPGYGAQIRLEVRTPGVDVRLFASLLRYLYTGDMCTHEAAFSNMDLLLQLGEEFGTPNALEHDLRYLLETGDYADAVLVFTTDHEFHGGGAGCSSGAEGGNSEYGFRQKLELPCHKSILSARSPFFRNLIQRRTRSGEEYTERALHIPTKIVLDESVIPQRYARVLLHTIYMDVVDLGLISRTGSRSPGLLASSDSQVQLSGPSPVEEAMELYQIGRFLELDILAQGCEDLIVEWLSPETLPTVLRWGSQPHGSAWVNRQALHFMREEFQAVAQSPVLHSIDKSYLKEVLSSDFLQASELEVLETVLKWGVRELVRRMEDREPNVVSQTAHSVARKGVKKRDLSDVELREILSELLPFVRVDHVLPPNSEVLTSAIRRGLVSTPPSHMIGDDAETLRINAWVRSKSNGLFVRPRLFMPYYEEAKALLEEHLGQELELFRLHCGRPMPSLPDIPDTLYMVEEKPRPPGMAGVDVLAAAMPVPDPATLTAMLKREQKLRSSPACQRALSLPLSSRQEINRQIRLRVVREFNLPDAASDLMEGAFCYCGIEESAMECEEAIPPIPPRGLPPPPRPRSAGIMRPELPAVVTEGDRYRSAENEPFGEGQLPDVAMATASFGQLQLQEAPELELDLGDGTVRSGASYTPLQYRRHYPSYETSFHLRLN